MILYLEKIRYLRVFSNRILEVVDLFEIVAAAAAAALLNSINKEIKYWYKEFQFHFSE